MINRINVRIFLGIFLSVQFLVSAAQNTTLSQGDSLFNNQKYTEAFEIYSEIYLGGEYSPAMLLKMAFIQDGLNNYAETLYYLNAYYQASADRQVIGKIEELVSEYELSGYGYNDIDYFVSLINKFKIQLTLLLLALAVLLLTYIIQTSRKGERAYASSFIQMLILVMLLGLNNLKPNQRGIIIANQTLLRSGPSAGAEPIEVLSKGHRVKILDQDNVWTKIQWQGEEVFVRKSRLKII